MLGHLIGHYRIVRKLGEGGMGAVYEARHDQLGRRAAIKVLHAHLARHPPFVQRFFQEARAVNIVDHPGLVEIFEFGQLPDQTTYLVMEFLRGEPLSQRLARTGPMAAADVVRLGRQLAVALAAAHEQRIVHRDLKPDNVMITPDPDVPVGERTKILDFGIAKLGTEHGTGDLHTETGALLGTPMYMSPEQCRGASGVTDRTDVYSLGVVFYQMLMGQPPFTARGHGEVILQHMTQTPRPLLGAVPGLPPHLAGLVHEMLEKAPERRPTMAQVAGRLEQMAPALPPTPPDPGLASGALHEHASVSTLGMAAGQTSAQARPRARWVAGALLFGAVAAASLLAHRPAGSGREETIASARVSTAPPTPAPRVRRTVESEPPGADVIQAATGAVLGRTPWSEEVAAGSGALTLIVRKKGFVAQRVALPIGSDVRRRVALLPLPPPPPPVVKGPPPTNLPTTRPPRRAALRPSKPLKPVEDHDVPIFFK